MSEQLVIFGLGLLIGASVALVLEWVIYKINQKAAQKEGGKGLLVGASLLRTCIFIGVILVVHKEMWLMIGVVVGLLIIKYVFMYRLYKRITATNEENKKEE